MERDSVKDGKTTSELSRKEALIDWRCLLWTRIRAPTCHIRTLSARNTDADWQ